MIISASRRTDIPAFYAEWFMNRVRAGFCETVNPFDRKRVARVSLAPPDVEVIVFWTRNAAPLQARLPELDRLGFRYVFLCTVLNNPRVLDPGTPDLAQSVATFQSLSQQIGPERVVWRYDPIVLSRQTNAAFHLRTFERIARELEGRTRRVIVSFVDLYRSIRNRMLALHKHGLDLLPEDPEQAGRLAQSLSEIAAARGLQIQSCAEAPGLASHGVAPGKCIDDEWFRSVFGVSVASGKDPGQRPFCGCVISRDIGTYDTCRYRCVYCYATGASPRRRAQHDPASPCLT